MDTSLDVIGQDPTGATIEAVVGACDLEADKVPRRALPLTEVKDDSAYQSRYLIASAEGVLDAIEAILDERVPADEAAANLTPLDAETFGPRIASLADARQEYLTSYIAYWSHDVVQEVVASDFTWMKAEPAFAGDLNVSDVNERMSEEFARCDAALKDSYFIHLEEAAKQEARTRRNSIRSALTLYRSTEQLDIGAWAANFADNSSSLDSVVAALRQPPAEDGSHALLTREVFAPSGGVKPADYYWSGLMLRLLELAANEGANSVGDADQFVKDNTSKRPLSTVGSQSLSFDQIKLNAEVIQGVAAGGGASDGWNTTSLTAMPSATHAHMRRLLGWGELDEDRRKEFARIADLMTVLVGEHGGELEELLFEAVLLDFDDIHKDSAQQSPLDDTERTAYESFLSTLPWLQYSFGQGVRSDPLYVDSDMENGTVVELGELAANRGGVRVGFASNRGADPDQWGELWGNWDLLMSLVRTNKKVEAGGKTYWLAKMKKVEILNDGSARDVGGDLDYYIGLRIIDEQEVRRSTLESLLDDDRWP